eukprot:2868229-Pleurochrysis_carterae.AAC.1
MTLRRAQWPRGCWGGCKHDTTTWCLRPPHARFSQSRTSRSYAREPSPKASDHGRPSGRPIYRSTTHSRNSRRG